MCRIPQIVVVQERERVAARARDAVVARLGQSLRRIVPLDQEVGEFEFFEDFPGSLARAVNPPSRTSTSSISEWL